MANTPKELLEIHTFDALPRDGAVFSSHGGVIADEDARRTWSVNSDLARSFISIHKYLGSSTAFTEVADALGLFEGGSRYLLPNDVKLTSFWEEEGFWKDISIRFAQKVEGTVSVAVAGAGANTIFRLFEYPALMDNAKVDNVRVIEGRPLQGHDFQYVNTLSRTFGRASIDEVEALESRIGKNHVRLIQGAISYDNNAVMSKHEWADRQKQEWFSASVEKLMTHLDGRPRVRHDHGWVGRSMFDPADQCIIDAKARFLQETVFCLREEAALRKKAASGDTRAAQSLVHEHARLSRCLDIMEKHPEVLYFDEPQTPLERARGLGREVPRIHRISQQMGVMFLRLDTEMDIESKNTLWGRYQDYDRSERHAKPGCIGKPEELQDYVRARIAGLKQQVQNALKPAGTHRPKQRETLSF